MFLSYLGALWVLWWWKNVGIISENICLIFFSSDSEMIIPPPWMYTKPSHREADIIYLICLMCQHTSCWVVAVHFFNNLLTVAAVLSASDGLTTSLDLVASLQLMKLQFSTIIIRLAWFSSLIWVKNVFPCY